MAMVLGVVIPVYCGSQRIGAVVTALRSALEAQRLQGRLVLRGSQLLYVAISFFVGTSLAVAGDALFGYRLAAILPAVERRYHRRGIFSFLCQAERFG